MSKLVLYLADGSTLDVRLARERITIGRRADNDVCLPYPAVSGEHAAVVTILSDSFLEDLASTNGTLVNGKPIAKHFLRDRDQIDIGRQKLVYVADDSVQLEPAAPAVAGVRSRVFGERVESAQAPPPRVAVPDAGPPVPEQVTRKRAARRRISIASSPPSSGARRPWRRRACSPRRPRHARRSPNLSRASPARVCAF